MSPIKDEIGYALVQTLEAIVTRAEKQPSEAGDLQSFVPIIDFDTLSTPNTQIIFGRNGTGKTHILKAFYIYCQQNFEQKKVLPIYIDCKDLDLGPVMPSISLDDLILRFYRRFIRNIIEQLKEFTDSTITVSILQKAFGGKAAAQKKKLNQEIKILNALLNMEKIEEMVNEYVRKVEVSREGSSRIGGEGGVSGELSISKPSLKVSSGLSISTEEVEKDKETIELVFRGLSVINYEEIRDGLERIIALSGAEAIIILVDEWSSVSLSIQPVLAEMIRKTLAISKRIFLKIVALKFFTRTSAIAESKQRIGFQMGIDIAVLTDLDQLLNITIDGQGVKDFLTHVAYRHVILKLPKMKNYTVKEFEDYLCEEIFANPVAYFEVVRASEGNPRDFLSILSACCTSAKLGMDGRTMKKIEVDQSVRAASHHFRTNKAPEVKNDPAAYSLFDHIFNSVIENRQKLFLITTKIAEKDSRVQELWHHRFIHLVNSDLVVLDEKSRPHSYSVYSMDYGKLLSIKETKKGEDIINTMLSVLDLFVTLDMVVGIGKLLLLGVIPEAEQTKLKQMIGGSIIAREGIESEGLDKIDYLVEHCVVDHIL
jgi:hypothetical protein